MKSIKKILPATRPHMVGNGFHVYPVFGQTAFTNEISPFLMFDYNAPRKFEATTRKLGVGQHPHRGFETVTISFGGEVEHRDSVGNHDIIRPGDVQWMTAASGIIHEEFISQEFAAKGGFFEMAQLWVNLPAKDKMSPPRYQPILNNEIPVVQLADDAGEVRVIAGAFDETPGKAMTFSPVNVWDMRIAAGKTITVTIPSGHNTIVFVRSGALEVEGGDGKTGAIAAAQAAILTLEGTTVTLKNTGAGETTVMILGGEPLNEPIAARGPFVMNTDLEIRQANLDYQEGRLGSHFA